MKKVTNVILVLVVIVLLGNVTAYSQSGSKKSYTKALTTDPINLLLKEEINIKYEQIIGKKNSFTADLLFNHGYVDALCIGVGLGYRWYMHTLIPDVRTRGIEGFAIAPFANIQYLRKEISTDNYKSNVGITVGVGASYKFVLFDGLAVEPAIRFGWGISDAGYYRRDFQPLMGVSIGYAW